MAKDHKKYFVMKPEVNRIFDELDQYRQFCVDYGFPFNEAHLGNDYSPYSDFKRWQHGKNPRDNWGWMIRQANRNYSGTKYNA
jgi:hypothetical protein